jgi:hypothetical protein
MQHTGEMNLRLPPSTQPSSRSLCTKAAVHGTGLWNGSLLGLDVGRQNEAWTCVFSLLMISAGVFLGVPMPVQPLAS